MKDVYEVLRQKEVDRERVQAEIEALRLTITLLDDDRNVSETESEHAPRQASDEGTNVSSESAREESASGGGWLDKWKMTSR